MVNRQKWLITVKGIRYFRGVWGPSTNQFGVNINAGPAILKIVSLLSARCLRSGQIGPNACLDGNTSPFHSCALYSYVLNERYTKWGYET